MWFRAANKPVATPPSGWSGRVQRQLTGFATGLLYLTLATSILKFLKFEQYLYNVALVFILIVLVGASQFGIWTGIVMSVLGFFALDFFFIPPYYTFSIDSSAGIVAVVGFLLAAILTSQIASQAQSKALEARISQQETAILNDLNQAVLQEAHAESMLQGIVTRVAAHLSTTATLLYLPDPEHPSKVAALVHWPVETTLVDETIANDVFRAGKPLYEATLEERLAYLPLQRSGETLGVMAVWLPVPTDKKLHEFEGAEQRWLNIVANQVALAVEHARLVQTSAQIESLQETDRLKSALLASVSHELRTPLTSIKTAIAGLRDEEINLQPAEQAEYLNLIDQESDRLSRLISNLLDLSRLETGTLRTQKGLYYLPEIIGRTLDRLQRTGILQQHPVTTRFAPDLPLVPVDYLQLEQVMTNLVENAAKYSRSGLPITIRVNQAALPTQHPAKGAGPGLLVEVLDEGAGVPEAELERIFDKFYRVEYKSAKGTDWQIGGTGLGLAITKGIIENHDGAIWAQRRVYGGTMFAFWLPLNSPELTGSNAALSEVGDQPGEPG